jgi:hypothetical protein
VVQLFSCFLGEEDELGL